MFVSLKTATLLLTATFLPATLCLAESWGPFLDLRAVDATGQFYVVMRKTSGWGEDPGRGGPVEFTFVQRRAGSLPVYAARDEYHQHLELYVRNPDVKLCDGDKVLGTGTLSRAPLEVLVPSSGAGFVAVSVHGYNYSNINSQDALVVVSADAGIKYRLSVADIFSPNEIRLFSPADTSIFWYQSAWIDEAAQRVVIVGRGHATEDAAGVDEGLRKYIFRTVSLADGKVQPATEQIVIETLEARDSGALVAALRVAGELGLDAAQPHAQKIAVDFKFPWQIRDQARRTLEQFGNPLRGYYSVPDTELIKFLKDPDPLRRLAAVRAIWDAPRGFPPREVSQQFVELARDNDPLVRGLYALALKQDTPDIADGVTVVLQAAGKLFRREADWPHDLMPVIDLLDR